jgi:hypothetical protein
MSCYTGSCLPAKVGSKAATSPVVPNPASLIGRGLTMPHVLQLQTHWEGSGVSHAPRFRILPPCGEGSGLSRVLRSFVGREPQA